MSHFEHALTNLVQSPARLVGWIGSFTVNWAIVAANKVDAEKTDPATLFALITTVVGVFCAVPAIWNSIVFLWRGGRTGATELRRLWAERERAATKAQDEPKQAG